MKTHLLTFSMALFVLLSAPSFAQMASIPDLHAHGDQLESKHSFTSNKHRLCKNLHVYGSFYTIAVDVSVDSGNALPLDQANQANKGISFHPYLEGVLVLNQPGNYLIRFGASAEPSQGGYARIGLSLNGVYPQPGSSLSLLHGMTSASTILHVPKHAVPANLALVNTTANQAILLKPFTLGDVTAFITIERLGN